MAMKRTIIFLSILCLLFACNNKKTSGPDVSGVAVNVQVQRFDKDFYAIDTNNIPDGMRSLLSKYPEIGGEFLTNVLGVDSSNYVPAIKYFIGTSAAIRKRADELFNDFTPIKKQFEEAFKYVKYYFPDFKVPNIITVLGPVDAMATGNYGPTPDFSRPGFIGISLQFYLGSDYPLYKDAQFIERVAPEYRSLRFSKEYIIGDAMQLVVTDLFPDNSEDKPLIEQMIERGKRLWLLDKFLPGVPDEIKAGYTKEQIEWCEANEGDIWSYLVKNEDIYSINPATIQTYIGEGPSTSSFPNTPSPGNLGAWVGWRIVEKFADKNAGMKPEDVMKATPKDILEGSKYKP
jgi:hypothetical protein